MNETTRRFLSGILDRVPEGRIVEVRLFPAIRQGGVESAIAVLAVEPGFDAIPDATVAMDVDEGVEMVSVEGEREVALAPTVVDAAGDAAGDSSDGMADPMAVRPVVLGDVSDEALERSHILEVANEGVAFEIPHALADATVGDVEVAIEPGTVILSDAVDASQAPESIALGDILALPAPEPAQPARDPHERLAILCARYTLTLKGLDRGTWQLDVVHQADAPLATLDRVIAGVVRRSGETAEPLRYSATSLREALDAPPWVEGAAA